LWSRRAGVRVPSVTLRAVPVTSHREDVQVGVRVIEGRGRYHGAGRGQLARSCRRARYLDVEHGGTDSADSDDALSSFGGDRLLVDQVRGNVDEVTLADLNCPVSPDLTRRHLADLRRARSAETTSSYPSH